MPVPMAMLMPMRGAAASTGRFVCTLYSVINSIYLRPVQRRVHPCRNLSVCRALLSPARLVANSRPFKNREKPSILITRAVVRRFKTPLHDSPSSLLTVQALGTPPLPPPVRQSSPPCLAFLDIIKVCRQTEYFVDVCIDRRIYAFNFLSLLSGYTK